MNAVLSDFIAYLELASHFVSAIGSFSIAFSIAVAALTFRPEGGAQCLGLKIDFAVFDFAWPIVVGVSFEHMREAIMGEGGGDSNVPHTGDGHAAIDSGWPGALSNITLAICNCLAYCFLRDEYATLKEMEIDKVSREHGWYYSSTTSSENAEDVEEEHAYQELS